MQNNIILSRHILTVFLGIASFSSIGYSAEESFDTQPELSPIKKIMSTFLTETEIPNLTPKKTVVNLPTDDELRERFDNLVYQKSKEIKEDRLSLLKLLREKEIEQIRSSAKFKELSLIYQENQLMIYASHEEQLNLKIQPLLEAMKDLRNRITKQADNIIIQLNPQLEYEIRTYQWSGGQEATIQNWIQERTAKEDELSREKHKKIFRNMIGTGRNPCISYHTFAAIDMNKNAFDPCPTILQNNHHKAYIDNLNKVADGFQGIIPLRECFNELMQNIQDKIREAGLELKTLKQEAEKERLELEAQEHAIQAFDEEIKSISKKCGEAEERFYNLLKVIIKKYQSDLFQEMLSEKLTNLADNFTRETHQIAPQEVHKSYKYILKKCEKTANDAIINDHSTLEFLRAVSDLNF
jgi:hypothetical protein